MRAIIWPRRCARGTPRRRIPTRPRSGRAIVFFDDLVHQPDQRPLNFRCRHELRLFAQARWTWRYFRSHKRCIIRGQRNPGARWPRTYSDLTLPESGVYNPTNIRPPHRVIPVEGPPMTDRRPAARALRRLTVPAAGQLAKDVCRSQTRPDLRDIPSKSLSPVRTRPRFDSRVGASQCRAPEVIFRFFTILFLATAVMAQDTSTGAIRGTVSDSAGARISAAECGAGELLPPTSAIPPPAMSVALCFRTAARQENIPLAPTRPECRRRPPLACGWTWAAPLS
jgi:hypothetical protein